MQKLDIMKYVSSYGRTIHQSSQGCLPGFGMACPRPFLKWAGGKGQLLEQLTPLLPKTFEGYHEPFVGSGAMYFHLYTLRGQGRLGSRLKRVWLTDSNEELINCYRVVKEQLGGLIQRLEVHRQKHSRDYYYEKIRPQQPTDPVERAARFIYLNKTCFNGLYRVNRQGQFNVPMGSYNNPSIFDPIALQVVSDALQKVKFKPGNFDQVRRAKSGDFVYFDPPYHPLSSTASFTSYTQDGFGESEQRKLAEVFRELDRKGCKLMLSNSWTPLILELYDGFDKIQVQAARAINSKADKRGRIAELVVLNYPPPNGAISS